MASASIRCPTEREVTAVQPKYPYAEKTKPYSCPDGKELAQESDMYTTPSRSRGLNETGMMKLCLKRAVRKGRVGV
jgi:hypothetical protein